MPRQIRTLAAAAALALACLAAAAPPAAAQAPEPEPETPDVLKDGAGRDETFYTCTACHSTALIRRSAFARDRWDQLLDWMTDTHGMPELHGEDRTVILDYLASAYGPGGRAYTNPFLRR
jgi:cytochrome c5